MSADEIRELADSGALDFACGFDINDDCGKVCVDDEISECQQKRDIRSALLAYADMVERCEKELAKFDRLLVPCCGNCAHFCAGRNHDYACSRHEPDGSRVEILANRKYVGYILRGDAGKEGK